MFNPVSTYRLQFHKDFTFSDLERIIPYLDELGIKTIYASPIFEAVPGSTHGYDGLNPLKINPEIGTLPQLRRISKKLKSRNISWIQDIVPNHMAFHPGNPWLMDVLEKGPSSAYKDYFDQSLSDELFNGPLMVPFLGSELDEVIDNGELTIEGLGKKFVFNYAGSKWPLRRSSYPDRKLPLTAVNQDKKLLKAIAAKQHYRLCSWKETNRQINFRRFFTVNGLICLNIQKEEVFAQFHSLINDLLKEDVFQGLRIDHIDGLYDPTSYLQQLRALCGDDTYIIVEKILEAGEEMSAWPIQGNTGYDFLAMVNNLFTNGKSEEAFTEFYHQLSGDRLPVAEQIRQKKAYILKHQMPGELDNLTHYFQQSGLLRSDEQKRVSAGQIRETIAEFLVNCPVYRFYGNQFPLSREERRAVKTIFDAIKKAKPGLKPAIKLLKSLWLGKDPRALKFYQRCMQFTGPLMAKGVEDTLMYTYNRFIAHNEVGDAPDAFGIGIDDFHGQMAYRQKSWPLSMNGTSTHDTKRGEDARARLNVLTDIAGEWLRTVLSWREMNRTLIKNNAPDANDEYFIYETLAGTYPMPGEPDDDYNNRVEQYLEKTLREAKLHSGWEDPNEAYEIAAKKFVKELLNKKRVFWKSFKNFHQKISAFGVVNSLTQVLLKLTAPGVPDTYQGCELWDLSMVDPDNRRPVDYDRRNSYLAGTNTLNELWQNKFTGQVKLRLLQVLLAERKSNPLVFAEGKYIPLKTQGNFKANMIAYARQYKRTWYVVAAALGMASISDTPEKFDWEDTAIVLPENIPGEYENLLSGTKEKTGSGIAVSTLFRELPLAFLKMQLPDNDRASGILMHITSLPSPFGVGDLGPGAKSFADFLHRGLQKYWQLLPLSPVNENNQYSPYSSWSAMGGNTLLISPELLAAEGLLIGKDLDKYKEPETGTVDFKTAIWLKELLFDTAWLNYSNGACAWLKGPFRDFCHKEAYWLNDFALYAVLKASHGQKPWYEWPDKFKRRDAKALSEFAADEAQAIEKTQWLQFIFNRQWLSLKKHCNELDIQLFGDLPFYVGYDSVDVWSHPELFSLGENLGMELVAGVPPDYFNSNGQLWGMPVFRWDNLKDQHYRWWVQRIKKNRELFDLLRLDHFRAFSSYWAVPATEDTAINGRWEKGPGMELFETLRDELGDLPFVAEDLGDIDDEVYKLRDGLGFPGMKVLQFAFGNNVAASPHIPHNYTPNHVAYTGTHDNNTLQGWFSKEAGSTELGNLNKYTGLTINRKNLNKTLIKMAESSVAKITVIPLQDLLNLDESARMNVPAATEGNWAWRLTGAGLKKLPAKQLQKWVKKYNRL